MAITLEAYTGTEAIGTDEWSMTTDTTNIATDTTVGMYQAVLDLNALAAGDVFDFYIYEKARSADTQRLMFYARFANAQATPNWISPAMILGNGWDMTLKKISGTDRTITWRISKVA